MRNDDLARALFDEECDTESAALARAALDRVAEDHPAWLEALATTPSAPPALIAAVLAPSAMKAPRRRWPWLWAGGLAAAGAAVATIALPPTAPPPPTVQASQPLALVAPLTGTAGLAPASGHFTMVPPATLVRTTPRVRDAVEAHADRPTEATRVALLVAMAEGGMTLREGEMITQIHMDPAQVARWKRSWPALLKLRHGGPGQLIVSE